MIDVLCEITFWAHKHTLHTFISSTADYFWCQVVKVFFLTLSIRVGLVTTTFVVYKIHCIIGASPTPLNLSRFSLSVCMCRTSYRIYCSNFTWASKLFEIRPTFAHKLRSSRQGSCSGGSNVCIVSQTWNRFMILHLAHGWPRELESKVNQSLPAGPRICHVCERQKQPRKP